MLFLLLLICLHLLPTVQAASTFLPAPMDWKPPTDVVKRSPLILEEKYKSKYRSWLLTNSSVTDIQFHNSLSVDLSPVERAPHTLVREILNQFPSIILAGDYVRDTVINNEKGATGSTRLDFLLDAGDRSEEELNVVTVVDDIKEFSESNNLFAASPLCVLETVDGCKKLQMIVCAKIKVDVGPTLDNCDATDEKITIHLVLGPLKLAEFTTSSLTLQKSIGLSNGSTLTLIKANYNIGI